MQIRNICNDFPKTAREAELPLKFQKCIDFDFNSGNISFLISHFCNIDAFFPESGTSIHFNGTASASIAQIGKHLIISLNRKYK